MNVTIIGTGYVGPTTGVVLTYFGHSGAIGVAEQVRADAIEVILAVGMDWRIGQCYLEVGQ